VSVEAGSAVTWTAEDEVRVGATTIKVSVDPGVYLEHPIDGPELLMVKRRGTVDWLTDRIDPGDVSTLLDLGVYKGGGTAFLNEWLRPDVHLAVELDGQRVPALDRFVAEQAHGVLEVVHGLDQADELRLAALLDEQLAGRRLDLVVDDASHSYRESRSSFEVAFPRLRPGGRYILEGWNWAHLDEPVWQHAGGYWHDRPALTNLIVELTMLAGSDGSIVSEITIDHEMVEVVRGEKKLPSPYRLAYGYLNRGVRFRPIL
jgi:hypothetical protein